MGDVCPYAVIKDIEIRTALGHAHCLDAKLLLARLGLGRLVTSGVVVFLEDPLPSLVAMCSGWCGQLMLRMATGAIG